MIKLLCFAITVLACAGCATHGPTATEIADTPESAYRELMLAMVSGDEKAIRNLIVETNGAETLWKDGGYPKDVAALLAEQYRTMDITRSETGSADRVELNSSAFPFPLTVIRSNGSWKVDPGPIIEARHKADSIRNSTKSVAPA